VDISIEKKLITWILHNPHQIILEEIEEWENEFEEQESRVLMNIILRCYRQCGKLDYGLLVQLSETDRQRQQFCALVMGEKGFGDKVFQNLLSDWQKTMKWRKLAKERKAIKEEINSANIKRDASLLETLQSKRNAIDRELEALKAAPLQKNG